MEDYFIMQNDDEYNEISLLDLFSAFKKWWLVIIVSGPVFGVIAYVILTFVVNTYISQVFLTPSSATDQVGSGGESGISAMSALAGINLSGNKDGKVYIAIEIIKSRKFAIEFVQRHNLKIELFALGGWDGQNNVIDPNIYDIEQKKWVRKVKPPMTPEPQDWEIYEAFTEILSIREDDNGFFIISLEGRSPVMTKTWLEWIVEDINAIMRNRDQVELEKTIVFLEDKIRTLDLQELKHVFSQLLEEQTRKLMMTESREDYVLEIIDPAFQPAMPAKPKRLLIIFFTMVLSSLTIGIILIFVEVSKRRNSVIRD